MRCLVHTARGPNRLHPFTPLRPHLHHIIHSSLLLPLNVHLLHLSHQLPQFPLCRSRRHSLDFHRPAFQVSEPINPANLPHGDLGPITEDLVDPEGHPVIVSLFLDRDCRPGVRGVGVGGEGGDGPVGPVVAGDYREAGGGVVVFDAGFDPLFEGGGGRGGKGEEEAGLVVLVVVGEAEG